MKAARPKPLDVEMWAAISPDGDVDTFWTRRNAVDHPTICQGHNGAQITWKRARELGWRVVKVRVTEVRR